MSNELVKGLIPNTIPVDTVLARRSRYPSKMVGVIVLLVRTVDIGSAKFPTITSGVVTTLPAAEITDSLMMNCSPKTAGVEREPPETAGSSIASDPVRTTGTIEESPVTDMMGIDSVPIMAVGTMVMLLVMTTNGSLTDKVPITTDETKELSYRIVGA
jgi:hypothetical protein